MQLFIDFFVIVIVLKRDRNRTFQAIGMLGKIQNLELNV